MQIHVMYLALCLLLPLTGAMEIIVTAASIVHTSIMQPLRKHLGPICSPKNTQSFPYCSGEANLIKEKKVCAQKSQCGNLHGNCMGFLCIWAQLSWPFMKPPYLQLLSWNLMAPETHNPDCPQLGGFRVWPACQMVPDSQMTYDVRPVGQPGVCPREGSTCYLCCP